MAQDDVVVEMFRDPSDPEGVPGPPGGAAGGRLS